MVTPEEIGQIGVFACLDTADRERVCRAAADINLSAGEYAAHEGDERALFAVLEGQIEATRMVDGIHRDVGTRKPGDLFGEVPVTLGTVFPVGFRAVEASRVMRIEPHDYHALASATPSIAEDVGQLAANRIGGPAACRASQPRRSVLARSCSATAGTATARSCAASSTATRSRSGGCSPTSPRTPRSGGATLPAEGDYPALRIVNGKTVVRPQLRRVAELLEVQTEPEAAEYDTVIVGGGPAGLAAAVYGASEGLETIVIEREAPGGQAGTSSRIENYLGFPSGVSGDELANRALQQAKRLGAEILVTRSIARIDAATRHVHLDGGDVLRARTIVLACGVSWRRLAIEGFDRLAGKGIFYGARAARHRTRTGSTSTSSAPATRPARPRCSSRRMRAASRSSTAATRSTRACRAT